MKRCEAMSWTTKVVICHNNAPVLPSQTDSRSDGHADERLGIECSIKMLWRILFSPSRHKERNTQKKVVDANVTTTD